MVKSRLQKKKFRVGMNVYRLSFQKFKNKNQMVIELDLEFVIFQILTWFLKPVLQMIKKTKELIDRSSFRKLNSFKMVWL